MVRRTHQQKLRRGTHRSVRDPNTDIRAWIRTWNDNPLPYVWTKTADEILDSIATYCTRINESRHACGSASAYVRGRNLAIVANAPGVALIAGDRRSGALTRYAALSFAAIRAKSAISSARWSGWSIIENVLAFLITSRRALGRASASRSPSSRGKKTSSADHATNAGLVKFGRSAAAGPSSPGSGRP